MSDKVEIIQQGHSGQVALPLNEEQFKDFIVSLLGKPQTITKRFRGSFDIEKEQIIGLFNILDQRIIQQNDSKLIQFRATIYYNDNSTTTLTGLEHLVNYNESLPVVSTALHLTWQYLIKFRDKSTYEKQEISISLLTDSSEPIQIDDTTHFYHGQIAHFRIQHTARTWGADIEGLLTKHLKTILKKDNKFANYFRYNSESVQNLVAALLVFITLCFSLSTTIKYNNLEQYQTDTVFWIHHYGGFLFLFAIIFFIIKVSYVLLEDSQVFNTPCFLLLTSESYKAKTKTLTSYKRNWWKYGLTLLGSLILGVISNCIYTYLTSK
jgi:hypothetical protein